jgi:hypothetical protein
MLGDQESPSRVTPRLLAYILPIVPALMYLAGVKVGSKEPKPFTARGLGYSLAFFSFHPHQKGPFLERVLSRTT